MQHAVMVLVAVDTFLIGCLVGAWFVVAIERRAQRDLDDWRL